MFLCIRKAILLVYILNLAAFVSFAIFIHVWKSLKVLLCLTKQGMMYGDMLENSQMPKEACLMIGSSGRFVSVSQHPDSAIFSTQSCSSHFIRLRCYHILSDVCQAREMEKRREGRPGDARAALRRSVRENGSVSFSEWLMFFTFNYSYFHFMDPGLT